MDIGGILNAAWSKFSKSLGMCIAVYFVGMLLGGMLMLVVVGIPILAGTWKALRKAQQGGTPEFNDLFSEFGNMGKWVMLWVVFLIMGIVACIPVLGQLALLIFSFLAIFTLPLMLERDLAAFDAIKLSISTVKGNIGTLILPVLVLCLISAAGSAVFGIGQLFTGPLAIIGFWEIYDKTTFTS